MKPLACIYCDAPIPEDVEIVDLRMGGSVTVRCRSCSLATAIPWGRVPHWLIERARKATEK